MKDILAKYKKDNQYFSVCENYLVEEIKSISECENFMTSTHIYLINHFVILTLLLGIKYRAMKGIRNIMNILIKNTIRVNVHSMCII